MKAQIYEVGLFAGGSNYIGDIGSEYYIKPTGIAGGVIYKWNANPRVAFRGTFTYAQIKADDKDATNRERFYRGIGFTNSIKELAVGLEFNYFEYDLSDFRKTLHIILQYFFDFCDGSLPNNLSGGFENVFLAKAV